MTGVHHTCLSYLNTLHFHLCMKRSSYCITTVLISLMKVQNIIQQFAMSLDQCDGFHSIFVSFVIHFEH